MDLSSFDPQLTGSSEQGLFGIPTSLENSSLALIPVPWEVTTSYGAGTSLGPEAILNASPQIDLFDIGFGEAWKKGFHWQGIDKELLSLNDKLKKEAQKIIQKLEVEGELDAAHEQCLEEVNQGCKKMIWQVYNESLSLLQKNKIVAVVGGDHSSPEGLIQAVGDHYEGNYGILHIDAHCDLRVSYQGFEHSHASIMHNVLQHSHAPKKLVQVGIRDFCKQEYDYAMGDERIQTYWDREVKRELSQGGQWDQICDRILMQLPDNVYISFDIDGLSPEFCPHTGTPVPGGLSYDQAVLLIEKIGRSQKKIIGFDLNEVAPDKNSDSEWDGNVGSRILFQLCGWAVQSKNL